MKKYVLVLIFLLAIFLRFHNLNWDSNQHIHPDERFLTMVGTSIKIPNSLWDYFNAGKSTLNPANVGYSFFVYGTFPMTINKLVALGLGHDNYDGFTIQGRFLSAFIDLLTLIIVYKIAKLLAPKKKSNFPLWAAFFYAIAVYPIQASHFFTTDSFQIFFSLLAVYFSLKSRLILSAFFFGLALSSKISAVYVLPLIFIFIAWPDFSKKNWLVIFKNYLIFTLVATVTVFIADPKFFTPGFISNLRELKLLSAKESWYPPLVQWLSKTPVVFSLFNLIFIGVGLPYFILVVVGMIKIILNLKSKNSKPNLKSKNHQIFAILIWLIVFFLYQSSQLAQSIRYLYILYPFLAIFAAIGLVSLKKTKYLILNTLYFILILLCLVWPLLFSTIYFHKHTRVEASEWIISNIENKSMILCESWDDCLPLNIVNPNGKIFLLESLPVFDPDTVEKWEKMNNLLGKADYYILSSNRGWGSIPNVPERYPKMTKFYQDLLVGKNPNYKLIKTFEPYYYRFLRLPNNWVEETFTVYDHPTVMIFINENK